MADRTVYGCLLLEKLSQTPGFSDQSSQARLMHARKGFDSLKITIRALREGLTAVHIREAEKGLNDGSVTKKCHMIKLHLIFAIQIL